MQAAALQYVRKISGMNSPPATAGVHARVRGRDGGVFAALARARHYGPAARSQARDRARPRAQPRALRPDVRPEIRQQGGADTARAAPSFVSLPPDVETSPNAEHIQFWNEVLLQQFLRFRTMFVTMGDAHSRGPLERAGLQPGMRALDIGCGFGETTLQLARLVAPGGSAVGTDCVPKMLEIGRADALRAGLANVSFEEADAQTAEFAARVRSGLRALRDHVLLEPRRGHAQHRQRARPRTASC